MPIQPINLTPQQKSSLKPLGSNIPTPTMGGMGETGGMGSNLGGSQIENVLKMAALADMGSGGKNITELKTLLDMFGTPKPTSAELTEKRKTQTGITGGLSKLGEIYSILDQYKGQDITGLGPSLRTKLGGGLSRESFMGKLLAPSQATNTMQAAISDYNTRLFDIAGKAFTGPEKSLLEGLVLGIGDDEQRLRDKMAQAQKMIELKAQEASVSIPKPTNNQGVPTSNFPSSWRPD